MSKKAYPCIGGPLDGKHAITDDFHEGPCHYEYPSVDGGVTREWRKRVPGSKPQKVADGPGGMYGHLKDDYASYNNAGYYGANAKNKSSMVWIHVSLLKPAISPGKR
jgi:hypothetical protein